MLTSKSSFTHSRRTITVWIIFLLIVVVYQSWILFPQVGQDILKIRKDIGQSGLWRSANFSQNQRFANYIQFILETIPQNARVILPAENEGPWALTNTPFMQFFLAPRDIINCLQPAKDCITQFSNSNTYFLVLDPESTAGTQVAELGNRLINFDSTWSVLQPKNPPTKIRTSSQGFSSSGDLLIALVLPSLWLVILTASGFMTSAILLPGQNSIVKFATGYGISLGTLSLSLYLTMLLGIPLTSDTILAFTLIFFVLATIVNLHHHQWRFAAILRVSCSTIGRFVDIWSILLFIVFIPALIVSVGMAYHSTDAIVLWGAKGYGIASQGLIPGASAWGTSTARYPLQIPIMIAVCKVLFNEILPASKLIFPLFYLGTVWILYSYLSKRVPRSIAGLSSLVVATTALVFRHANIGYANLPLSFFIVSGILIFSDAIDRESSSAKAFFLTGALLMFAAWTRPEGLLLSYLIAIVLVLISSMKVKVSRIKNYLPMFAPLVFFTILWLASAPTIYQTSTKESLLLRNTVNGILEGDLHLSEFGFILKYLSGEFIDPSQWGFLPLGILILFVTCIFSPMKIFHSYQIVTGLLSITVIVGLYYLTSYDNVQDISWWVSTGLNRMILPGVILLWVGVTEINFSHQNQSERKPGSA